MNEEAQPVNEAAERLEHWLPEHIRNDPEAMANFRWRVRDALAEERQRVVAPAMAYQQTGYKWGDLSPETQEWWQAEADKFVAAFDATDDRKQAELRRQEEDRL